MIQIIKLMDANEKEQFKPSSVPFMVTGVFILWVCWLFFNGASGKSLRAETYSGATPQKVIMNTILGGSAGVMFTVMIRPLIFGDGSATNKYDIS